MASPLYRKNFIEIVSAPTHYADWDAPGRRTVPAICGTYIRRTEHSNEPTCPQCRDGLAYRAQVERDVERVQS